MINSLVGALLLIFFYQLIKILKTYCIFIFKSIGVIILFADNDTASTKSRQGTMSLDSNDLLKDSDDEKMSKKKSKKKSSLNDEKKIDSEESEVSVHQKYW